VATFVLVHGAMHGGWCWRRVLPHLRGHAVYTPTLTGMGERAHLLTPTVDLSLHVRDILGVLSCEDLDDVILVGHSYAGMVVSAVAEKAAPRLRHLVYLDAFPPHDGEAAFDLEPPGTAEAFQKLAQEQGDCWRLPPSESLLDRWGVRNEADRCWVLGKLTSFPLRCFQQPVMLPANAAATQPRTYIECVDPINEGMRPSHERVRAECWRLRTLASGHDAMIIAPAELARLLLEIADCE